MNHIGHIYVLNLDRSPDRWKKMKQQQKFLSKPLNRISGIDGSKLTTNEMEDAKVSLMCRTFCTPGIIGCFLSHKKVWETLVNSDDEYAIIMEDDCEISSNFEADFELVMNEILRIDPEFDFCFLGYFGKSNSLDNRPNINRDEDKYSWFEELQKLVVPTIRKSKENVLSMRKNKYIYIPESPVGFHCYLLSKKGAQKLLSLLTPVKYHVDVQMLWNNEFLNIWASKKKLGKQTTNSELSVLTDIKLPILLNKLFHKVCDSNDISYSYYLTAPAFQVFSFPINLYFIISLLMVIIYKPFLLWIIYYFILDFILYKKHFFIICEWISILYIVSLISNIV